MSGDQNLTSLLDGIVQKAGGEQITVDELVDVVGHSAFHALILVPALIITSPASGIPGLSSSGGLMIAIVAAQHALGRGSIWLPQFILKRSVSAATLRQAVKFLRKPSEVLDRILRPRLTFLVTRPASQILAIVIMMLGLAMPALEFVPFSASIVAAAISLLSLALLFRDGLLLLLAGATSGSGVYALFGILFP